MARPSNQISFASVASSLERARREGGSSIRSAPRCDRSRAFTVKRTNGRAAARISDPGDRGPGRAPRRQEPASLLRSRGAASSRSLAAKACECGAANRLTMSDTGVLAKASERTGLGRLTVPLWRTGKSRQADRSASLPPAGSSRRRARHQRHLAGTETRLRAGERRRAGAPRSSPRRNHRSNRCKSCARSRSAPVTEHTLFTTRGRLQEFHRSPHRARPNAASAARIRWLTSACGHR